MAAPLLLALWALAIGIEDFCHWHCGLLPLSVAPSMLRDRWGRLLQPLSSSLPLQTLVGNHEIEPQARPGPPRMHVRRGQHGGEPTSGLAHS